MPLSSAPALEGSPEQVSSRKGYTWDVGLHYVGQMDPKSSPRRAFDFITRGQVRWQKMASPFEAFSYPGCRLDVPDDPKSDEAEFARRFPADAGKLRTYFRDIGRIDRKSTRLNSSHG